MDSEEISLGQLLTTARKGWPLMLGLALVAAVASYAYLSLFVQPAYDATASLVVRPPLEGAEQGGVNTIELYRSLSASDSILQATARTLVAEGVLPEGATLELNRDLRTSIAAGRGSRLLQLTATSNDAVDAAAMANTWATVLLKESSSMRPALSAEAENFLGGELTPTRAEIEEVEAARSAVLADFAQREEDISLAWDRRIAGKKKSLDDAVSRFQAETRALMEKAVADLPPGDSSGASVVRSRLLEIGSLRAQLAQTPRVLSLEKAASDETLAELLVDGANVEAFDNTVVSEEINPLHSELAVRALTRESDLGRLAGGKTTAVSELLRKLETLQMDRAAGLAAIRDSGDVDLRTLRRSRRLELDQLMRERKSLMGELGRRLVQLEDLDERLSTRLNEAVVARLLSKVEPIQLVAPAVEIGFEKPRRPLVRVVLAGFLGAVLGLLFTLFRGSLRPERRA